MNQGRAGWEAGREARGGPGAGQVCRGPRLCVLVRVPPALTPVMGPSLTAVSAPRSYRVLSGGRSADCTCGQHPGPQYRVLFFGALLFPD